MTIAAKLLQTNGVKEDIRDAIESFGFDLSESTFFDYAQWICDIGTATQITITADPTAVGTIADDLTQLSNIKTDIKNAIESKGIDLTGVPFSEYADYIYQIQVSSPLRFTAKQNGSVGWSTYQYPNLEYSKNGGTWTAFTASISVVTGDYVEFRNNGTAWSASTDGTNRFSTTGLFDLSGNIMSLVDSTMGTTTIPSDYCFNYLFGQCNIDDASELKLPATTLRKYCYLKMFYRSTITKAPKELPAMNLEQNCYEGMFQECSTLVTAPEILPATTLADSCYKQMFYICSSLQIAPELPATTLVSNCYYYMFDTCRSLVYIKALFTTTPNQQYTANWVRNVSSTGTFVKNHNATWSNTGYGYLGVPNGWTVEYDDYDYLKFTANTDGSTIKIAKNGNAPTISLEVSDNGKTWMTYNVGDTIILTNAGHYVMFRGNNQTFSSGINNNYYRFSMTGSIAASGKITSLYDSTFQSLTIPATYFFVNLFQGCTSLTTAPELPATTLAASCYWQMFKGCTSLTSAPELPATTLTTNCYKYMFQGCTSLTTAPELQATALGQYCYGGMFDGCTSLTHAPELPATSLTQECYNQMFQGCTSLITAPELPATTLAMNCYGSMFQGCTSLTTAPEELPATTLIGLCYSSMFQGCTSLTTAPELPATTLAANCYKGMFLGCTSLNYIKCLATNISSSGCTVNWVSNVSATGTFVKDASMNDWTTGANGIPSGWTVQNAS